MTCFKWLQLNATALPPDVVTSAMNSARAEDALLRSSRGGPLRVELPAYRVPGAIQWFDPLDPPVELSACVSPDELSHSAVTKR